MPENPPPPTWIEPPPPKQSGMGCFAKGCLVTVIVLVVLFFGLMAAGFFGVHYMRDTYLSKQPKPIPVAPATPEEVQTLKQEFKQFKETARQNESLPPAQRQPAHLEYTAAQINQLIASGKGRGHASVSINNGVMMVSFSLSMDELRKGNVDVFGVSGRYLNGNCSVSTSGPTAPSQIVIQDAQVNGRSVSPSIFDTSYRGESLRSYVARYASDNSIGTFQIVADKVDLDTPLNQ